MKPRPRSCRIAVAQPLCVPGDVEGNLRRMEPLARQAAEAGARLVLFGEAGVTGYEGSPRCLRRAVVLGDRICRRLHSMARRLGLVIAAGFWERNDRHFHVTHGVFYPDGRLVVQRKARPGPPERTLRNFKPGPGERTVFEVDGVRCALAICADSGIKDLPNDLARAGVQLLLAPTAGVGPRSWGFTEASLDDPSTFRAFLKKAESVCFVGEAIRLCHRHRIAMAACNQMGDDGRRYFHPGHSCIVDSTGELVALIPGVCVFEHLRERVAWGDIHPQTPRLVPPSTA